MTPEVRAFLEQLLELLERQCGLLHDLLANQAPAAKPVPPPTENLTWEQALAAMKENKAVARAPWKDKRIHIGDHLPHYTMTIPAGTFATVLSQHDLNACDWMIVPEG